ncbi:GIY-YIG nuclease family protein [Nitrosomonas ureae]|uniref:GIY-YIG domain-containing protein n=1 Tax=Nitrosomonas ureae TaxID=44577 RepID=A0A1H5V3C6_9PROT|nr:GIY-YIG nuclease family protein [Nitrosomonas ureae]SEF80927.1 hypothetical protein SAMN05216334_11065 [Nitrosomonas ureae]
MSPLSSPRRYAPLGFPPAESISTLRSVAHLFGSSKNRCGIYLLEFPGERFYIGQAIDVARRFGQHRKNYEDIAGFSFIPIQRGSLDQVERDLIQKAELLNLVILNTVHASNVIGETDLDMVLSQEEQAEWLSSPVRFNTGDAAVPIALPSTQLERFSKQFHKFKKHPLYIPASDLLTIYIHHCIPAPKRTEYSFWVVSCLPATNRSTWPRLLCVSAGVMELLVLGFHKDDPSALWGFVTVASDVLSDTFKTDKSLIDFFPSVEIIRRQYRDAGQHQITLWAADEQSFAILLQHRTVQEAAALLALRVMRKRATIYSKFHCKQVADHVIDTNN